jgi:hypothetical protein
MRAQKGKPFMHIEADSANVPLFSEAFFYGLAFQEEEFWMTKGDARFIMGVAEEYSHIIKLLGPEKVRELLELHTHHQVTFTVSRQI